MLVAQLPATDDSLEALFGQGAWFNDQFIEEERGELEGDNAIRLGGVGETHIPSQFEDAFYRLIDRFVGAIEAPTRDEMERHCVLLGAFAIDCHNDYQVDVHRHRWLLVLQCGSGYTLNGAGPEGDFSLPLKAGQLIAFDEWQDHSIEIDQPGQAAFRKANLFLSLPNPSLLGNEALLGQPDACTA